MDMPETKVVMFHLRKVKTNTAKYNMQYSPTIHSATTFTNAYDLRETKYLISNNSCEQCIKLKKNIYFFYFLVIESPCSSGCLCVPLGAIC